MTVDIWAIIGMNKRLERLSHKMHAAAVDGNLVRVESIASDGQAEVLGLLALDYARER